MTKCKLFPIFQNADDNSYPSEAGVVPALAFVVEKDCITVLNNETGFQEKNIRAICDVGRSTKGKHQYGYIGKNVHDTLRQSRYMKCCLLSLSVLPTELVHLDSFLTSMLFSFD